MVEFHWFFKRFWSRMWKRVCAMLLMLKPLSKSLWNSITPIMDKKTPLDLGTCGCRGLLACRNQTTIIRSNMCALNAPQRAQSQKDPFNPHIRCWSSSHMSDSICSISSSLSRWILRLSESTFEIPHLSQTFDSSVFGCLQFSHVHIWVSAFFATTINEWFKSYLSRIDISSRTIFYVHEHVWAIKPKPFLDLSPLIRPIIIKSNMHALHAPDGFTEKLQV